MFFPRLASTAFFVWFLSPALAQPPAPPDHGRVPRIQEPVKIDGRLDEAAWNQALVIELPFEVSPGENIPAPVRTECLLMYAQGHLYAGFRAWDPDPQSIRAHVTDRDNAQRNDSVGILIDPFHDGRRGFSFNVNPLGVQTDATSSDLGGEEGMFGSSSLAPGEDFSWDAIWDAAGRITEKGYEVELAIPFSTLRFPRDSGEQTWGVIAYRSWPRDVMHKIRSVPVDRNRNCFFCQGGTMTGLSGMVPGRNLEFDPTLTAMREDQRDILPGGPLRRGDLKTDLGLSARWGVTPNLSLNAGLNPDFSQVEADAVQISFNRRFALYYPEKRPFFQEGADFFNTPMRAVYSRTVVDPSWGLKLTGKEGRNALGAIVTRDASPFVIVPGPEGSSTYELPGAVNSGIFRFRRDLGESSALGVLASNREGEGYHNRLLGLDGYLRLSPRDTLEFQVLGTRTRYPEAEESENDELSGIGGSLEYRHGTRDWSLWAESVSRGGEFRADAGFIPRVGFTTTMAGLERSLWAKEKAWYNRLRFGGDAGRTDKTAGGLLDQYAEVYLTYDGPLQSFLNLYGIIRQEAFAGEKYDTSGAGFFFNIRPTGDFTTSLETQYGWAIDYGGLRRGRVFSIEPGITWNIGPHLYFQLDHAFERFSLDEDWLYRANLTKARLVYQFNVRLFARAILQRDDLDLNPRLAGEEAEPHDENLYGQYLLSYKINPQTLVYVGYSDSRQATRSFDRTLTGRTFFFKLGYAWIL